MSDFDEKMMQRLKRLEREVERLKRWESPGIWKSWSPTLTGWSSTTTLIARYARVGKFVAITVRVIGTSNSTLVEITLPIVANDFNNIMGHCYVYDNGVAQAIPGYVYGIASNKIRVLKEATGTPWTASGGKRCNFHLLYEAA